MRLESTELSQKMQKKDASVSRHIEGQADQAGCCHPLFASLDLKMATYLQSPPQGNNRSHSLKH